MAKTLNSSPDNNQTLLLEAGIDVVNRRIQAFGAVDLSMQKRILNGLTLLNGRAVKKPNAQPITIMLSTYGGYVEHAFGIYELIKRNPCPVRVIALGPCFSAGTLIMQAAQVRAALPSSTLLLHFGSMSAESRAEAAFNELRHKQVVEYIVDRMSASAIVTPSKVKEWHDGEKYFTAEEALNVGLIDEIVEAV